MRNNKEILKAFTDVALKASILGKSLQDCKIALNRVRTSQQVCASQQVRVFLTLNGDKS